MALQNRVDPFGNIHAEAARGQFTGNRGVIHDPISRTLLRRRWSTKAWIVCDCHYRGWKRDVMGSNAPSGGPGWTNLFFLDEVTALSAGHRPCFTCRRERARAFRDCLSLGLGLPALKAGEIDAILHGERRACGGEFVPIDASEISALPNGAMVAEGGEAFAVLAGRMLPWRFEGYARARPANQRPNLVLLTPPSTVAALRAGYRPVWHPSAAAYA